MEHEDKKIKAFIDKLMLADSLEQPTSDFTDKVMFKVETLSASTIAYKPLIPKSLLGRLIPLSALSLLPFFLAFVILINKKSVATSFTIPSILPSSK